MYLIVSIERQERGRQLGVSVHNVVHLHIRHKGGDVVVLDAAQLQIKQCLHHRAAFTRSGPHYSNG